MVSNNGEIICPICGNKGDLLCNSCDGQYTWETQDTTYNCPRCSCSNLKLNRNDSSNGHSNCTPFYKYYYECESCDSKICGCFTQNTNLQQQ